MKKYVYFISGRCYDNEDEVKHGGMSFGTTLTLEKDNLMASDVEDIRNTLKKRENVYEILILNIQKIGVKTYRFSLYDNIRDVFSICKEYLNKK